MKKLNSGFVLKKYKGTEKLVELHLNFGYKEYNALSDKYTYKPLRYYTGVRVQEHEWDKQNKVPYDSAKLSELLIIERTAHDIYNYLTKHNKVVTPEQFKAELDKMIKGKHEVQSVIGISEYIREVIMKGKNGRSAGTLKNYNKLANRIEEFETIERVKLTANNLNEDLYLKFIDFIRRKVNRINTVWDASKVLKAVLNEIRRKYKIEVFNPSEELAKGSKVSAHTEDKIYMDFETIQRIIEFEPVNERLKNTKLILLTLLFSGCRYSDVFKIRPIHEYNENGIQFRYARFIDEKTGTDIIVPILKPLEDAIEANNNETAYVITDVKFNVYVKELCELVGLNQDITLSFTDSSGKKRYEVKPFYQFVTSHIGRRSFITNLINHVPITILTKITGHSIKDKSIIFSYNKISLLDNAALFVKELQRITKNNPIDFPFRLV